MALPDFRKSSLLKHGKRADARKRKLAFLAFKPEEYRREAQLSQRVTTLEKQLEASRSAQARLTAELATTRQQLAQAEATVRKHDAERHKAVQRYADIIGNYGKLADKYNELCDNVQTFITGPVNPFVTSGLMEEIESDLAKTHERQLCAQFGVVPLPPPPARTIDALTPCS